jgi:hypothetical protein
MKLTHWVRFTWDLQQLPQLGIALPDHYHFRDAESADEKDLRAVISRSFAHDTSWGDSIHEINSLVDGWLARAFSEDGGAIFVTLRHGPRIIGAAISFTDPSLEDQLSPGPCVLMEYRNRGLGTALLGESLRRLRESALTHAHARARSNSLVAKFLYPKFNGTITPDDKPLLAA